MKYMLYAVPCTEETEEAAHLFKYTCVSHDVIFILSNKKVAGAIELAMEGNHIPPIVHEWLKESLFEIDLQNLSKDTKAKKNVRLFIERYRSELDDMLKKSQEETEGGESENG